MATLKFHPGAAIGELWCSVMHDSPRWPIHDHYECAVCGRQYPVPWTAAGSSGEARLRPPAVSTLRSAIVAVVLLWTVAAWPGRAAESLPEDASPAAATVLQRFIANQSEAGAWPLETIDVEASLPSLKKTGRLRAIRSIAPVGQAGFKVLEVAGDPTVKNQVIVRYISADEKANQLPFWPSEPPRGVFAGTDLPSYLTGSGASTSGCSATTASIQESSPART
jgi:hypothetical protein